MCQDQTGQPGGARFKNTLIATDGSDLAEKAVQVGARAGQGRAAEKRDCDVIVMASHGQSGFTAAFLGSETQTCWQSPPFLFWPAAEALGCRRACGLPEISYLKHLGT